MSNNIDQLIALVNQCCDSDYNICTAQSTLIRITVADRRQLLKQLRHQKRVQNKRTTKGKLAVLKRLISKADQVSNNIDQLIALVNQCCDSDYNICTVQSTLISIVVADRWG